MRMTEIRCTDPVRKVGTAGNKDKSILLKRGTTVLFFDGANTATSPAASIQAALFPHNTTLSEQDKKKFFQAFYEDELSTISDSFERKIASIAALPNFSFLFADGLSQKLLRTRDSSEDMAELILPGSIGTESGLLAQRLDWGILLDDSVDVVLQRKQFLQLKERLELSRDNLAAPAQGKLYRTRSELISVLREPALKVNNLSADMSGEEEVRSLEYRLQNLKEKDEELRKEQRTLMLLSIKNDYESLLKLRRDLEELESNTTHYARTITGQGRDITVHELTVLSSLYQDYQEEGKSIESQREEIRKAREERYEWEQKRILSDYKVKRLQEKIAESESEQYDEIDATNEHTSSAIRTRDTRNSAKDGIGLKHILLLGGFALLLSGLLLYRSNQIIAVLAFVLTGITLTAGLILSMRQFFSRQAPLIEGFDESLRRPVVHEKNKMWTEQLAEQKSIWHLASDEADRLAQNLNRRQIDLHALEKKQSRAEKELLRQLSLYAEIDDLADIEYVLDALRNQRQSVSSYDESVSEYLRQIADVRKGRTDEDMLEEYEHACEELYGDLLTGDDAGSQDLKLRSQSLNYDQDRARRIEIERVDLSQNISRSKQELQELKMSLQKQEEFFSRIPILVRRRDSLEQSLWQEIEDIEQLDFSIALLDYFYTHWRDIPLDLLRSLTLKYSRRLQGLQPVDRASDDYMIEEQRGIRRGELHRFKNAEMREKELSLLENTPSSIVYLAFRMAFLDCKGSGKFITLFVFDLPFLNTAGRISELLNLLDERMLELSAQSILFTSNNLLTEIARERLIPVHMI